MLKFVRYYQKTAFEIKISKINSVHILKSQLVNSDFLSTANAAHSMQMDSMAAAGKARAAAAAALLSGAQLSQRNSPLLPPTSIPSFQGNTQQTAANQLATAIAHSRLAAAALYQNSAALYSQTSTGTFIMFF